MPRPQDVQARPDDGADGHDSRCGMKRCAIILVAMLTLAFASAASAQTTKPAKPTAAVANASCVTSECHKDVKDYKVIHGPVNVNACDACHKLEDAKQHKFTL